MPGIKRTHVYQSRGPGGVHTKEVTEPAKAFLSDESLHPWDLVLHPDMLVGDEVQASDATDLLELRGQQMPSLGPIQQPRYDGALVEFDFEGIVQAAIMPDMI